MKLPPAIFIFLSSVIVMSIPVAVALPTESSGTPTTSSEPPLFDHKNQTVDFNGLKVRSDEIELLGYALGYRNAYNAVEESVSGRFKSPATIIRFCNKSLEVDRLEILETFQETKPADAFVERLERGLVEGHEDGEKAGRNEEDRTPIGRYMTKLREGILERAVYERARTKGLGGKEVHRIIGSLKTQRQFFYRSSNPPPTFPMNEDK
jgi:hypothetical protein